LRPVGKHQHRHRRLAGDVVADVQHPQLEREFAVALLARQAAARLHFRKPDQVAGQVGGHRAALRRALVGIRRLHVEAGAARCALQGGNAAAGGVGDR